MAKVKTARQIMLESETEAEFQAWLIDVAHRYGWKVHFWPDWMRNSAFRSLKRSRRRGDRPWPDAGFPDVWCVNVERGELVVFECKKETAGPGRVSKEQREWLSVLEMMGVPAYVVRPRDRDEITKLLSGKYQSVVLSRR